MGEQVEIDINVQVDGAKTVASLKKDLKEAQGQAIAISRQFGETSKEALAAAKRVAMLKDEIADVNERVKLFDPGAKFQVFGNAVQTVTAGFTAAQGAMALFGSESQDLQKQLVKLQGALALSQGLSAITDSWKDFQRLGAVIKTQVVTAFTTLRGAMMAVGWGLVVAAVGAIVTNFEAIEKWLKKIIPGFEGFAAVFGKVKAVAVGTFKSIIEGFKIVGELIADVFTGDFSEAAATARDAGSRIGKAYADGFNEEVQDQAEDAAKKLLELQAKADARLLKVLQASGEKRAAEASALQRKMLVDAIAIAGENLEARKDAEAELQAFDAKAAADREAKAKENAKKAEEKRKADGQKALAELQKEQGWEYKEAVISGKDVFMLKTQQLNAQLELAKKYGLDLKPIQDQIKDEELARREKLNEGLKEKVTASTGIITAGLVNVDNNMKSIARDGQIIEEKTTKNKEEAELRKQAAMQSTNEIMSGLLGERESLSDLEKGAVIATMLATEFAEAGKRDAVEMTQSALKIAAKVLGEQSAIGKGVAIANTTIDTIRSASGVFSGMVSTIPGPVGIALGVAGAAAALIAGYARVKQIVSVKVPGAPGTGGASPSMPSAPAIPRVQSNTGVMVDQLDQINTNMRQPQRVQVVESEITETQNRVQVIENNAKF